MLFRGPPGELAHHALGLQRPAERPHITFSDTTPTALAVRQGNGGESLVCGRRKTPVRRYQCPGDEAALRSFAIS